MLIFLVYKPDETKKKADIQKNLISNQSLTVVSVIVSVIGIIVTMMVL